MKERLTHLVLLASIAAVALVVSSAMTASAATIEYNVTSNVTIGDGGVAVVSLVTNITGISETPAAVISWSLKNLDSFDLSKVNATVVYRDQYGWHTGTPELDVDTAKKIVSVSFEIDSTTSSTLLINVTLYLPALPGIINQGGLSIPYSAAIASGGTQEFPSGSITVYIVPEPPLLSLSVYPSIVSPGLPVTINASARDGSGVANLTLRVLYNGSTVYEKVVNSSVTGNATAFSTSFTVPGDKLAKKGVYNVVLQACDIIGNCGEATKNITVTNVFYIPGNFTSLSEALASPSVGDNVTLAIRAPVNESSTVAVSKKVTIAGITSNAAIVFSNTSYGLNITVPGVTVKDLKISGADTGFLVCSDKLAVSGVSVEGKHFLEVCSTSYLDNVVTNSSLNGIPVYYSYEETKTISGEYSEMYLFEGNYTLAGTVANYLETFRSSIEARNSSISSLVDLGGSSIELYDTSLASYTGSTTSRLVAYSSLLVKVLYNDEGLGGVNITVKGALLSTPVKTVTNESGEVFLEIPIARGTASITEENTTVMIIASYLGLTTNATVDLATTHSVTLSLPSPSLQAVLRDIFGNAVTQIKPGQIVEVDANYSLQGFTGDANITAILYRDGNVVSKVTVPLGNNADSLSMMVFVPWMPGTYTVEIKLELQGLPPIVIKLP